MIPTKKQKSKPRHLESGLQKSCVRYYRYQFAKNIIVAIPNGGRRSGIEAAIMQGEGVLAGFPDLMIITPNEVRFIEMKVDKGRLTDNQKEVHERLKNMGYRVDVCRSLDEFVEMVKG